MKKIETMLLSLAIGVFTICGVRLGAVCLSYRAAEKEYREVMAAAAPWKAPETAEEDGSEVLSETAGRTGKPDGEFISSVDFRKLSGINPDIVGWLEIPALEISYPVVQAGDNSMYLKKTFYGNKNDAGCIFMDFRNDPGVTDRNTILYGHNMKNGTMFGKLKKYRDEETAKNGRVFFYSTPESVFQCEILSCRTVSASEEEYPVEFRDSLEFMEYTGRARQESGCSFETAISEKDRLITLSTCSGEDAERFVVQARIAPAHTAMKSFGRAAASCR
ncbi:MAG: class B sortase [Lachnospiraceae bacterium]|nr:class B sortase [Lachnospiraceae bacterium]